MNLLPLHRSDRRHSPVLLTALFALVLTASAAGLASPAASAQKPDSPTHQPRKKGKVILRTGHVDAASARIVQGRLETFLKDATRGNNRPVRRKPASTVIRLNAKAKVKLPAGMGFVGPKGKPTWLIPQTQRPGVIWAGWNTEEIDQSQVRGDVTWTLRKVTGPGKLVVFQTGSFGESDVIFNSRKRLPQRLAIPVGTHAHGNWAFTKKGLYRMRYTMSAVSAAGKRLSDTGVLTFQVG